MTVRVISATNAQPHAPLIPAQALSLVIPAKRESKFLFHPSTLSPLSRGRQERDVVPQRCEEIADMAGPLSHIRVLDLSRILAGRGRGKSSPISAPTW